MGTTNTLRPVIVSASRSTDIPAFYADWFVGRLREGWCEWKNPFNGEVRKVSFDKTRMIVFWSKNPKPMLERLDEEESFGFRQYYFQFTLNDYVNEGLEPNVPCVEERIDTFRRLADRIGRERVIWRFDPLLLTDKISIDVLLERIAKIGRQLKGYTEKLVFSFIDIASYRKVQKILAGLGCREFSADDQVKFAKGLAELNGELGLELATSRPRRRRGSRGRGSNAWRPYPRWRKARARSSSPAIRRATRSCASPAADSRRSRSGFRRSGTSSWRSADTSRSRSSVSSELPRRTLWYNTWHGRVLARGPSRNECHVSRCCVSETCEV